MEKLKEKFRAAWEKVAPVFRRIKKVIDAVVNFFKIVGSYLFSIRKPIMAVPVVLAALRLAQYNATKLPEQVGLDLQATGEYAFMISRNAAVLGPLAVTALCLVLMFLSRRTVYPWVISIFSLVLPVLIFVTNAFPA